jgi:hypothetical protein
MISKIGQYTIVGKAILSLIIALMPYVMPIFCENLRL